MAGGVRASAAAALAFAVVAVLATFAGPGLFAVVAGCVASLAFHLFSPAEKVGRSSGHAAVTFMLALALLSATIFPRMFPTSPTSSAQELLLSGLRQPAFTQTIVATLSTAPDTAADHIDDRMLTVVHEGEGTTHVVWWVEEVGGPARSPEAEIMPSAYGERVIIPSGTAADRLRGDGDMCVRLRVRLGATDGHAAQELSARLSCEDAA